MAKIKYTIETKGSSNLGKRELGKVGKAAIGAAAEYWFDTYLPLHFMQTAYRRYQYKSRAPFYTEMKADGAEWHFGQNKTKSIGEVKPIVWSGQTRAASLGTKKIKTFATNSETVRAEVVVNARVANFTANNRINLRDELTRFTPQEERKMERIFAQTYVREYEKRASRSGTKTRRVAA